MKRFRQFCEVVRSPKRARKLLDYMTKKDRFDGGHEWTHKKSIKTPLRGTPEHEQENDEEFNEKLYHNDFRYHRTAKVPMHNIRYTQKTVDPDKVKDKLKKPTEVALVHHKGFYHVVDGHHSITAHRLKGATHIKAKIYK